MKQRLRKKDRLKLGVQHIEKPPKQKWQPVPEIKKRKRIIA